MRARFAFLLVFLVALVVGGGQSALAAPTSPSETESEIFATNNTAIITDPRDPRLETRLVAFGRDVREIVRDGDGQPDGSTLLDGVFWSSSLMQTTYERSREFGVDRLGPTRLHDVAEVVRQRFHQESVLTFELLPRSSPAVDAVQLEVPGFDVQRLHDGLVADPVVRDRLGGGSVTLAGTLILIAALTDLPLVRRFVAELGGSLARATLRFGASEFVS